MVKTGVKNTAKTSLFSEASTPPLSPNNTASNTASNTAIQTGTNFSKQEQTDTLKQEQETGVKYSRFIKKISNIQNCTPLNESSCISSLINDENENKKIGETDLVQPILPTVPPCSPILYKKEVISNIYSDSNSDTYIGNNTYIYICERHFSEKGGTNPKNPKTCSICGQKSWIKTDVFLCEKCYKKQVVKPMKKQPEISPPENAVKCPDCGLPWATAGTYETMNGRTYNHHCKYCGMCNNI